MSQMIPAHRDMNRVIHPQLVSIDQASAITDQLKVAHKKPRLTLVHTKTQIPGSYGDTLRRERLEDLFTEVRRRLLTLVMAPPGCGKSTLACQWAKAGLSQGMRVAWLSIDADDNDPHRFMLYLHQALVQSGIGQGKTHPFAHGIDPDCTPAAMASAWINWVASTGKELLVILDNYAWITETSIHEQVAYILANAPSNLHLVLLTSDLPPLPIGRLRARNQLLELDSGTIRFTKTETLTLFRKNASIPIPYAQLEELYRFTQGWAAVVRIISLSIGNFSNPPSLVRGIIDCRIFDAIDQYLDDLFVNFPEDLVDMMIDTSIVDSLSLPLCLALSDCGDAETYFCQIRQQQILIPSDLERGRYTYPAPVRRYLQKKLLRKGLRHMAMLHRRAHAWYAGNAHWDNAVNHALAVGDTRTATELMELHGMSILKVGSYGTLLKWHRKIAELSVEVPERVWLSFAWAHAVSDTPDPALDLVARITATAPVSVSPAIQAECHAIRAVALVLSDRIAEAVDAARACTRQDLTDRWMSSIVSSVELYCHLHSGRWSSFFSESSVLNAPHQGETNTHVLRLSILGLAALLRGQLALAERYSIDALQLAPTTKDRDFFCFSAWPCGLLAAIYYEQGQMAELEALLSSRLESITASGYLDCTLAAYMAAARSAADRGGLAEALAILERAEGIAATRKWPRLEAAVLLERVRLFLEDDRLHEAEGCLQRLSLLSQDTEIAPMSPICSVTQMLQMGQAHLAIHSGHAEEAVAPLAALLEQFTKTGNELFAVRIGTLLSIAHFRLNHNTEAERVFRDIMTRAERAGFLRSVLDQGAEAAKLLNGLCATLRGNEVHARLRGYCERTLAAWRNLPRAAETHARVTANNEGGGTPLTPKEHDVLALMARGQSNKEIARSLNVAPETIKTHLKNIFLKLSVDRRIQAIAKAQALGLLAREPA